MRSFLFVPLFLKTVIMSIFHRGFRTDAFLSDAKKKSARSNITMLTDSFPSSTDISRQIFFFDSVVSTMDTARELIDKHKDVDVFSVTARVQTSGRGTKGRKWLSADRNLYLTVVVKVSTIHIPLTLVPLRIGTLLAPVLSRRVLSGNHVRLKWPNDVLVGDKKLCGILIEMDDDRLLIGIGCNVMTAPVVTEVGIDGGRQSTSLSEHDLYTSSPLLSDTNSNGTGITTLTTATDECKESTATDNTCVASSVTESEENMNTQRVEHYGTICEELAAEITAAIANWIRDADNQDMVISEFESWMDFSPQILRKEYKTLDTSKSDSDMVSLKGETIIPIRLNSDGTLVVKLVNSGEEKVLIADYLW